LHKTLKENRTFLQYAFILCSSCKQYTSLQVTVRNDVGQYGLKRKAVYYTFYPKCR